MPITEIVAGTGSSGCCAHQPRISAASAASSTLSHTRDSEVHTDSTSIIPSRSAEATRASSARRRARATPMALSGSVCLLAVATSDRPTVAGSVSSSFGPAAPSP